MAADVGSLARIEKVTGNASAAREWALTASNFGAKEAEAAGFLSKVVEGGKDAVLAEALKTAKLIASKSPIAVIGTKRILLHARDHGVAENLAYTLLWNSVMLQTAASLSPLHAPFIPQRHDRTSQTPLQALSTRTESSIDHWESYEASTVYLPRPDVFTYRIEIKRLYSPYSYSIPDQARDEWTGAGIQHPQS